MIPHKMAIRTGATSDQDRRDEGELDDRLPFITQRSALWERSGQKIDHELIFSRQNHCYLPF